MKIDRELLDGLSARAKTSERLRMNLDMRTSAADSSQRMLNALEPSTVLPIHRHRGSSETCLILRGRAEEIFYDDEGRETERVVLAPDGDCAGVSIERGRWHRIVALEPDTVIFEAKDGAYAPISTEDILDL